MRDVELYRHLLGLLPPWTVDRVELSVHEGRVDVWARHAKGERWACPVCGVQLGVYDHSEERTWRHLDSCQFLTFLHARPVRVKCPEHGVKQVAVPWAEGNARFTSLFERMAIDVLQETSVEGGASLLRLSWDQAWHIMERAVARGRARKEAKPIARIGVDEKAVAKRHQYFTLVYDIDGGCVEDIQEGRKKESLDAYFTQLTSDQLDGIEAVAMDMWEPFVSSVKEHLPDAEEKIVFDRFHIMKHMVDAVNDVRKQEHRALMKEEDETLKGTRNLWLYSSENVPVEKRRVFSTLRALDLATGRAWAIKENLRRLWSYVSEAWARKHWKHWYFWATHSQLKPVIKVARMIQSHLVNVLTYTKHRITNAVAEGVNSKVETVKKMACGYRNKQHFKTAIYFHCGGLDLYPATHGEV